MKERSAAHDLAVQTIISGVLFKLAVNLARQLVLADGGETVTVDAVVRRITDDLVIRHDPTLVRMVEQGLIEPDEVIDNARAALIETIGLLATKTKEGLEAAKRAPGEGH